MLKCEYCGRFFKGKYETCPGCGAALFKETEFKYDLVIETPPKDGYKIKIDYDIPNLFFFSGCIIMGIVAMICFVVPNIPLLFPFDLFTFGVFIGMSFFPLIVSIVFITVGIVCIKNINNKVKKKKRLAKTGILIKNLEYESTDLGNLIRVKYITKNGAEIPITGIIERNNNALATEDKNVDLLIDPNDQTNYYIDFEIY